MRGAVGGQYQIPLTGNPVMNVTLDFLEPTDVNIRLG